MVSHNTFWRYAVPSACIPLQACLHVVANVRKALALSMLVILDGNTEQPAPMSAACLQVYSNVAVWKEGALRVRPFHRADIPHRCPDCPSNLCKGQASSSESSLLSLYICWPGLPTCREALQHMF